MESDTFYGDFMVKLVWRLSGVFMGKKQGKSNYQTMSILVYHKIAIKSITLHTVSILST